MALGGTVWHQLQQHQTNRRLERKKEELTIVHTICQDVDQQVVVCCWRGQYCKGSNEEDGTGTMSFQVTSAIH